VDWHKPRGTVPVKLLRFQNALAILVQLETAGGMVPVNCPFCTDQYVKLVQRPSAAGTVPTKPLLVTENVSRCVNSPSSDESVPRTLLSSNIITVTAVSAQSRPYHWHSLAPSQSVSTSQASSFGSLGVVGWNHSVSKA
jgi:hypothetical protein